MWMFSRMAAGFNWLHRIVALCIALLFIWFGLLQWPGLHWDACLYATPVINVASGQGWVFGGYPDAIVLNETKAYQSHGVIHVLIFGTLLKANTWERYFLLCGFVNAVTFVSWTFIFQRTLRRAASGSLVRVNSILSGLMTGVLAMGLQGRPEHLALLCISCPLILRELGLNQGRFELLIYGLGGVLFMLSPASGLLMAMGVAFWISLRFENQKQSQLYRHLLMAACAAVISSFLVSLFCPFSWFSWLSRLIQGQGSTLNFSDRLFRLNWKGISGISMQAPFWNIIVLATTMLSVSLLYRQKKYIGLTIFTILALYCWPKLTDYGYVSFLPLILVYLIGRPSLSLPEIIRPNGRLPIQCLQGLLGTLYALAFARAVLSAVIYVKTGTTLMAAREVLESFGAAEWQQKDTATVFHGWSRPSFVVLGDGGERFIIGMPGLNSGKRDQSIIDYTIKFQRPVEYFIYPQVQVGSPPRELFVGLQRCELIYDGWVVDCPAISFLDPGSPPPGYQFALYKRVEMPEVQG